MPNSNNTENKLSEIHTGNHEFWT